MLLLWLFKIFRFSQKQSCWYGWYIGLFQVYLFFVSRIKSASTKIKSFVLGGHGDSMVAMLGSTEVEGKKFWISLKREN